MLTVCSVRMIEHMTEQILDPIVQHVQQAHQAVLHATDERNRALAQRKALIKELAAAGVSTTDISAAIGISRSRVGLILNDNKILNPGVRKKKRKPRAARSLYTPGMPLPEWDGVL